MWRQRQHRANSDDSATRAEINAILDSALYEEYELQKYHPITSLHRWFYKPLSEITTYTVDFKQGWLNAVSTLRHTTN